MALGSNAIFKEVPSMTQHTKGQVIRPDGYSSEETATGRLVAKWLR